MGHLEKYKAILYCRYDHTQAGEQYEPRLDKLKRLNTYCRWEHIEIIREYRADAPDTHFERLVYPRLLKDYRQGKLKANLVLMTDWDEISSDVFVLFPMIVALEKIGIKIKCIYDLIDENAAYASRSF